MVFERGPYVSFANCGLPYYVGNAIQNEQKLLVASAELFKTRFNIEVRTENEVMSIDRERREIEVKLTLTGESTARSMMPWFCRRALPRSVQSFRELICPEFSPFAPSRTAEVSARGYRSKKSNARSSLAAV